ncbi:hypothetical protein L1887_14800 [Cichorium endivia]|nr:hypothetical protein L1887_14800 [Cichorium endivia]
MIAKKLIQNRVYGIVTEGSISPNVNDSIDSNDVTAKSRLISEVDNPSIMESESNLSLDLRKTVNVVHKDLTYELNLEPKLVRNLDMNQKQNDIEMIYNEANKGLKSNDEEIALVVDEDRALQKASKTSNSLSFLAVQVGIGSDFCESNDPSCPRDVSTGIGFNNQASNGILESENPVFQAHCDNSGLGKKSKRCSDDEMLHFSIYSSTVNSKERVRFLELDWNGKNNEHVDMVIDKKKPWVNSFQSNVSKTFAETIVL